MVMIPRWKKFPLKLISRWKQEFLGGKFPPFHHLNYTLLLNEDIQFYDQNSHLQPFYRDLEINTKIWATHVKME